MCKRKRKIEEKGKDVKNQMKQISSHIQMPKFMLRRFSKKESGLFFYDVKGDYIAPGFARSINTEEGYYSIETEKRLNNLIEQPFARVLQYVDKIDFDLDTFDILPGFVETARSFLNALLARSPMVFDKAVKTSVTLQFFDEQTQHDRVVSISIDEALKMGLFNEYYPTFTINKTEMPFVLPVCGFYFFNKNKCINFPIRPDLAITFVDKDVLSKIASGETIHMYLITKESEVNRLNYFAYNEMKKQGYGRIVSPSRKALEEMMNVKPI